MNIDLSQFRIGTVTKIRFFDERQRSFKGIIMPDDPQDDIEREGVRLLGVKYRGLGTVDPRGGAHIPHPRLRDRRRVYFQLAPWANKPKATGRWFGAWEIPPSFSVLETAPRTIQLAEIFSPPGGVRPTDLSLWGSSGFGDNPLRWTEVIARPTGDGHSFDLYRVGCWDGSETSYQPDISSMKRPDWLTIKE